MATTTVFPVLRYREARAAIDWLIQAFGFQMHAEHATPDGLIAHAELRFGPSTIGISSATPPLPGNPWSAVAQGIYACVDDVDAHYATAEAGGADIIIPLRDTGYGSREYSARDREGYFWAFGSYDMGRGDGAPTLFPEVHYRDPYPALDFLTHALSFKKTFEVPAPDGGLIHAELHLADGVVMVGALRPNQPDDTGQLVCAFVEDVDRHHARAKAGGAKIERAPADTPFGARQYVARDPEGFVWLFGNYKPS